MDTDRLVVAAGADAEGRRFLEARIDEFNVAQTGFPDEGDVTMLIRDQDDAIVAGVRGWTWGGCLQVAYLWVREDRRGLGYGSRLLAAAERIARERGCAQAIVETHDFQAPAFYLARGYEIYATLDGYPAGHKKHFLRKPLL